MKYKGYELMKAIAEGKIKSGTKFKTKEGKEVKWNGYNLMSIDFNECYMCIINDICFINEVFELTEDEIDIDSIEELNDTCYDVNAMSDDDLEFYHNKTRTTINEILQAVKQINKEVKELKNRK